MHALWSRSPVFVVYKEMTRMHSSRMRTVRFSCHFGGGGVCPGGRGVGLGGCLLRGCTRPAHCMLGYNPPVNLLKYRCENIIFPQLSLRAVKIPRSANVRENQFTIDILSCNKIVTAFIHRVGGRPIDFMFLGIPLFFRKTKGKPSVPLSVNILSYHPVVVTISLKMKKKKSL